MIKLNNNPALRAAREKQGNVANWLQRRGSSQIGKICPPHFFEPVLQIGLLPDSSPDNFHTEGLQKNSERISRPSALADLSEGNQRLSCLGVEELLCSDFYKDCHGLHQHHSQPTQTGHHQFQICQKTVQCLWSISVQTYFVSLGRYGSDGPK